MRLNYPQDIENLAYNPNTGAKNWLAIVAPLVAARRYFGRFFLDRTPRNSERARFYDDYGDIGMGHFLEMAGDGFDETGNRVVNRRYFLVEDVGDDWMVVTELSQEDVFRISAWERQAKPISDFPDEEIYAEALRRGLF